MSIVSIISLLSGLAFFLFGMSLMGDALKRVAGRKLETLLRRLTFNAYKGVGVEDYVAQYILMKSRSCCGCDHFYHLFFQDKVVG